MRCRIFFPVEGSFRLAQTVPIEERGWVYDFVRDTDNRVTAICISVPLPDASQWPRVVQWPSPGVAASITYEPPHFPFVRRQAILLQGIWSMYGVERIRVDHPTFEWLPESADEKRQLQLYRMANYSDRGKLPHDLVAPFDVVARSIMAIERLDGFDVWYNLFRRGSRSLVENDFADALRHFYFVLESLFSNGKWRGKDVVEEMRLSTLLSKSFNDSLLDEGPIGVDDRRAWKATTQRWGTEGFESFVKHLVSLRGDLQHHSGLGRAKWHPEDHEQMRGDALFLQCVVMGVLFEQLAPHLWHPDIVARYEMIRSQWNTAQKRRV